MKTQFFTLCHIIAVSTFGTYSPALWCQFLGRGGGGRGGGAKRTRAQRPPRACYNFVFPWLCVRFALSDTGPLCGIVRCTPCNCRVLLSWCHGSFLPVLPCPGIGISGSAIVHRLAALTFVCFRPIKGVLWQCNARNCEHKQTENGMFFRNPGIALCIRLPNTSWSRLVCTLIGNAHMAPTS